jgi:hypothetical protein
MTRARLSTIFLLTLTFVACRTSKPSEVCGYQLTITSANFPNTGGQGTATVTPNPNTSTCSWSAVSTGNWLTLSGTTSASGQASFDYSAGVNNTGTQQNGAIRVTWSGGSAEQPVTEAGGAVPMALNLSSHSAPAIGGNGFVVRVTTAATWSAHSNAPWLVIRSFGVLGPQAVGDGQVVYDVLENPETQRRQGQIIIEGGGNSQTLTVDQDPKAACVILLSSHGVNVGVNGTSSGSTSVTATCPWTATSNAPWLRTSSSGSGNGTLTYTVDSNANNPARVGTITVTGGGASDTHNVDQPSGVVEPKFTWKKTSTGNPGICEVLLVVGATDPNGRMVIKCEFDASTSVNSAFITSYRFTLEGGSPALLGDGVVITDPKSGCGFPAGNTRTPLKVTLTVVTTSGLTKTQTQEVPFIRPTAC